MKEEKRRACKRHGTRLGVEKWQRHQTDDCVLSQYVAVSDQAEVSKSKPQQCEQAPCEQRQAGGMITQRWC
jgi:hypothetical protein